MWESAEPYLEKHRHPLVAALRPAAATVAAGPRQRQHEDAPDLAPPVEALRAGREPFFDVYDSVTSSVVSPLTEQSVASRSRPVEVPDFTRGRWKTRAPIEFA